MTEQRQSRRALLDVNVWIALLDPWHVHHAIAHQWFNQNLHNGWASCPLTQNAVLRILGHPRYPNSPGDPRAVAELLGPWLGHRDHCFWPDAISLIGSNQLNAAQLLNHSQITDTYLLALAIHHKGHLVTLDRRLQTTAVVEGESALTLILEA